MVTDLIDIEVAYAKCDEQAILAIKVAPNTTVHQAIELSGIIKLFPEIAIANVAVGVFGKVVDLGSTVKIGDRIEIYRPLLADPKEQRRKRAEAGKSMKKRT